MSDWEKFSEQSTHTMLRKFYDRIEALGTEIGKLRGEVLCLKNQKASAHELRTVRLQYENRLEALEAEVKARKDMTNVPMNSRDPVVWDAIADLREQVVRLTQDHLMLSDQTLATGCNDKETEVLQQWLDAQQSEVSDEGQDRQASTGTDDGDSDVLDDSVVSDVDTLTTLREKIGDIMRFGAPDDEDRLERILALVEPVVKERDDLAYHWQKERERADKLQATLDVPHDTLFYRPAPVREAELREVLKGVSKGEQ